MLHCCALRLVKNLTSPYCPFHKHTNSKVHKPPSQLRFSLPSIIITITSNEPWNTKTHKTDRNPPITNHKPWPFEPVKVKFCFLRGPLRWLTAAKNAIVSWLLNFKIRMFVKSAVTNLGLETVVSVLFTNTRTRLPYNERDIFNTARIGTECSIENFEFIVR